MQASATPLCSVCCETLGKYGGPVTLPCGHNGCLQCMASVRRSKPECPLCRNSIPADVMLVENKELRDLIALATALYTVPTGHDEWEAVTSCAAIAPSQKADAQSNKSDITLVPTAPPAHMTLSRVMEGEADLLSLEPPGWLPDSHAQECGECQKPFRAVRRARHHCRLCGGIFCASCSSNFLLLPPKFQKNQPERLCSACATLLQPLQPFLAGTIAPAVRAAVHDVTDSSALRSWLNSPLSSGLAADIYTAANILHSFVQVGRLQPEKGIPAAVLSGAVGFAILSVAKVGLGWSWAMGSGLVVVKQEPGGWSPPAALNMASLGWGFQAGGALHDLLIVLRNEAAVQAFCGGISCGVGGNISLAVGPMGRQADANVRLGKSGAALCYSYSCSKGIYAGVAVEGTVITSRDRANLDFYGRPLTARQLLTGNREGSASPPAAAQHLYRALDKLMAGVEPPLSVAEASRPDVSRSVTATASTVQGEEEERAGRSRVRADVLPVQSVVAGPASTSVHASQVMGAAEVPRNDSSETDEEHEEDSYMGAMFAE